MSASASPPSGVLLSPLLRVVRVPLLQEPEGVFTGARLAAVLSEATGRGAVDAAALARTLIGNEVVRPRDFDAALSDRASQRFCEGDTTEYVFFTGVKAGHRLPCAVITAFAPCYSPSCTPDDACYAPGCPRKVRDRLPMRNHTCGLAVHRPLCTLALPPTGPILSTGKWGIPDGQDAADSAATFSHGINGRHDGR
jgi:hypothetical protein